jgi:hypothetical protein
MNAPMNVTGYLVYAVRNCRDVPVSFHSTWDEAYDAAKELARDPRVDERLPFDSRNITELFEIYEFANGCCIGIDGTVELGDDDDEPAADAPGLGTT